MARKRGEAWNRCDYCGRFISMDDFGRKRAKRICVRMDSEVSGERYDTYHIRCREKRLDAHNC